MNDALFKQLGGEMSPEVEAEFTRRLAAAYREQEAGERRPEVERIARLVRERLCLGDAADAKEAPGPEPQLPQKTVPLTPAGN